MPRLLKLEYATPPLASPALQSKEKTCWIALENAPLALKRNGDILLGKECHSFADLESVIAEIRGDLDSIETEAQQGWLDRKPPSQAG